MELTDAPIAAPGCCALCLRTTDQLVDTLGSMPMHGRVYLCPDCVTEAARLIGLVPEPEAVNAQAAVDEAAELLDERTRELNELYAAVGTLFEKGATVRRGKISLRRAPGARHAVDLPEAD